MKVVLLVEWDNPKDEARDKKGIKFNEEFITPYWESVEEKGIKITASVWSDNTGHMVGWYELEDLEEFTKWWNDERMQQMWSRWTYLVDNVRIRLLRPGLTIPEDMLK